jgi:hypothetical protein
MLILNKIKETCFNANHYNLTYKTGEKHEQIYLKLTRKM